MKVGDLVQTNIFDDKGSGGYGLIVGNIHLMNIGLYAGAQKNGNLIMVLLEHTKFMKKILR